MIRARIFEGFAADEERAVAPVLQDLASSGLVFSSGQGRTTLYRAATEPDRIAMLDAGNAESLVPMVWVTVFHNPGIDRDQIARQLSVPQTAIATALETLRAEGRVSSEDWPSARGLCADVYGLLAGTRSRVNELWHRVKEYNEQHPSDEREKIAAAFWRTSRTLSSIR